MQNWLEVDISGLRKILERRGKEHVIYELVQNAWDEEVSQVVVSLHRPAKGLSKTASCSTKRLSCTLPMVSSSSARRWRRAGMSSASSGMPRTLCSKATGSASNSGRLATICLRRCSRWSSGTRRRYEEKVLAESVWKLLESTGPVGLNRALVNDVKDNLKWAGYSYSSYISGCREPENKNK